MKPKLFITLLLISPFVYATNYFTQTQANNYAKFVSFSIDYFVNTSKLVITAYFTIFIILFPFMIIILAIRAYFSLKDT